MNRAKQLSGPTHALRSWLPPMLRVVGSAPPRVSAKFGLARGPWYHPHYDDVETVVEMSIGGDHVHDDTAATRGVPSLVWRAGQDRRLGMMRDWAEMDGARILVDGCGVGMYVRALGRYSSNVHGLDIESDRIAEAQAEMPAAHLLVAAGERLPYTDASMDIVVSHEVMEHVEDARQMLAEALRVLRPGGRLLLFCPNRLYPFETHGHYWRGRYHFGNTPLINWLPDRWRNRLAPHVRAYTRRGLQGLLHGLPGRVIHHTQIYPGFDNVVARWGSGGRALRGFLQALEQTPLRAFGLSHYLVVEKEATS